MKKTKLTVGIMSGLLCVSALAGCDKSPVYSPEGYILTYTVTDASGNKQEIHYTADELFDSYYLDSSKTQTMFDSIYKLIVRNYFTLENPDGEGTGSAQYQAILDVANRNVEADKQTANKNADTNGTKYDDEFNSILATHGCKDEDELLEYYIYQGELEKFQDNFYDKNISLLRDGKHDEVDDYDGWLKTMAPYHVSHLLVKVDDGSSTNYWNATIGKEDAEQLKLVTDELAKAEDSFGHIANLYSEDEGSAASFGDLGIMDKSTSYVDEFKLGIYAYENIYGDYATAAGSSKIAITAEQKQHYKDLTETVADEMPTIPFGVFDALNNVKDVVKAETSGIEVSVNDDNANFYPRNIIFNEFLNKHAVAFITPEVASFDETSLTDKNGEHGVSGTLPGQKTASDYEAMDGFQTINGKKVLCARVKLADGSDDYRPILAVRAGADSYQGIHFIILNRSPFETTDKNGVSLSDYYTTYFPSQNNYPKDEHGNDLQTYVNFNNLESKQAKERAESVQNSIKSFDSDLNKFIYKKYKAAGKIQINDAKLDETINNWIEVSANSKLFNDNLSWEKTWDTYLEKLEQQNNERSYKIALTCAIGYVDAHDASHTDLYDKVGGLCNDGKKH